MQTTGDPQISEWGNLFRVFGISADEFIVSGGETRGTETSQYPQGKEIERDSLSSGERKGKSLNSALSQERAEGCGSFVNGRPRDSRNTWKGIPEKVKVLYAKSQSRQEDFPSTTGHGKSCGNLGRPRSKAKY